MTRDQIEKALDTGRLWAAMPNGAYWPVHRNGRTRTWKRDADRFRIPVKAGQRVASSIHQDNLESGNWIISDTKPPNGPASSHDIPTTIGRD